MGKTHPWLPIWLLPKGHRAPHPVFMFGIGAICSIVVGGGMLDFGTKALALAKVGKQTEMNEQLHAFQVMGTAWALLVCATMIVGSVLEFVRRKRIPD